MNRLKKHQTANQIRTVMERAVELELLRKRHAALLKTCEDIEKILTFVPATHDHVLPKLRKAIAAAKEPLPFDSADSGAAKKESG